MTMKLFPLRHITSFALLMNRFTDGLRLPSEDEAIKTYKETCGNSFEELRRAKD